MPKAICYFLVACGIAILGVITVVTFVFCAMYFSTPDTAMGEGSILDDYFYQSHAPSERGLEYVISGDSYDVYVYDPAQCGGKPMHFVQVVTEYESGQLIWSFDHSMVAYETKNQFLEAYDFETHRTLHHPNMIERSSMEALETDKREQDKFIRNYMRRRGGEGKVDSIDYDKTTGISQWSIDRNFSRDVCTE
jgi:hypothetical protein